MKPTGTNLWGIHAGKTRDAASLFLQKRRDPSSRFCN